MQVVETLVDLHAALAAVRRSGQAVGLVPTMGYLHEGHLSLMRASVASGAFTVVSIFVNPTQFAPGEDLESYPRDLEGDQAKCESTGVDLVFCPEVEDMYPPGASTWVEVRGPESLMGSLCGRYRPRHFSGVTTVVSKLFHAVRPERAYFGRKDYQQLAIIRRMVRDLLFPLEVVGVETVREPDGLAMSSRNAYLDAEERRQGVALSQALRHARSVYQAGERSAEALLTTAREQLAVYPLVKLQYLEIVDPDTLASRNVGNVGNHAVMAVAAHLGSTRLIDNIALIAA